MTRQTDTVDNAAVAQTVEINVGEISTALSILRCVSGTLHADLDECPPSIRHACTVLEIAILRISEARDGLSVVSAARHRQ